MRKLKLSNKFWARKGTAVKGWCVLPLLAFLLFTLSASPSFARTDKANADSLQTYLTQEKTHLSSVIEEIKLSSLPNNGEEYDVKTHKIGSLLTITKAKIESLQGLHDNTYKAKTELYLKLKHVQQLPLASADDKLQQRVKKIENLLVANRHVMELIDDNLELNRGLQNTLNNENYKLELWNARYQLEQKIEKINQSKHELNQKLSTMYQSGIVANAAHTPKKKHEAKDKPTADSISIATEARTLINNQYIALIHHQITALNLQKKIIKAKLLILQNSNAKTLQFVSDIYSDAINQNFKLENSLKQMLAFSTTEAVVALNGDLKHFLASLKKDINKQLKQTNIQQQILSNELTDYQNQLKKLVSARQSLSDYNIQSWPYIFNKLTAIPGLFYNYIKTLAMKVYDSYSWLSFVPVTLLWSLILVLTVSSFVLNRFLKSLIQIYTERSRFTGYLYDGLLSLIQRNIPYFCFIGVVWLLLYFTNISYSNYQLLFHLFLVYITFRVLILIARLGLLERISDSSGKDVNLYYRLKWLFLFGGWVSALMTFSHLLPLSLLIQDIFNRLFMLFILTMSFVIWRSKDTISYLLRPLLIGRKRYFKHAISLLVVLIPITLFLTAITGLFGYITTAWVMSRYLAYASLVLIGYILARGLLFDALEYISETMITTLSNGWLWIEVFLKPADKICRIILLLFSLGGLFQLYGWHADSPVVMHIKEFAGYTIVNLNGIHITVASTIEFLITLSIFVWAAIWTREFCFRWLFKSTKDAAIRNSLSVFTQYAVILIGGFITLRVLGLDFSGMSMVLGGLAVGMGFGLRDFASNIVGGIMLLIERPVREGDLITIGEYEGQVSHIGIRCMRVSSWDNTEVLIPNAETFNKPFTNWTHQDGIVRTVIPIKVSRADDPIMVQQLILDVLAVIPEIVPDPPAQVFLKKIDEALIEFEVRYFINVQTHSRVEVRSAVLFAITAQFKAAGIRPPVEPLTIEFKEGHGEFLKHSEPAKD